MLPLGYAVPLASFQPFPPAEVVFQKNEPAGAPAECCSVTGCGVPVTRHCPRILLLQSALLWAAAVGARGRRTRSPLRLLTITPVTGRAVPFSSRVAKAAPSLVPPLTPAPAPKVHDDQVRPTGSRPPVMVVTKVVALPPSLLCEHRIVPRSSGALRGEARRAKPTVPLAKLCSSVKVGESSGRPVVTLAAASVTPPIPARCEPSQ
jgi:hypothetical protein